jgi:hypothetical protein
MASTLFKVINFIWFQTIWVVAILWQQQWLGLLALLITAHLIVTPHKRIEIGLWLLGGALGITLDSVLALTGFFVFTPAPTHLPIPWWLVMVWCAFLGTLRNSLAYLLEKPLLAIGLGAIFAPISYFAGMRLGAVAFGKGTLITLAIISFSWAILMPLLIAINHWLCQHLSTKSKKNQNNPRAI